MSMNFSEFKRLLNSDPASQDPEYQAARRSDPEFIQAAQASDAFELRLAQASGLSAPANLAEQLKALASPGTDTEESQNINVFYRYRYAMAATVVLAVSAMLLMQQVTPPPWDSVEGYVAYHYSHDGHKVLDSANQSSQQELDEILASFDLQMDPALSDQVQFVKYCPTPEGQGVHLVLNTPQGLVTVIIMPGMKVQDSERFAFDGVQASLVQLTDLTTSAAIIGQAGQLDADLDQSIQSSIFKRSIDA